MRADTSHTAAQNKVITANHKSKRDSQKNLQLNQTNLVSLVQDDKCQETSKFQLFMFRDSFYTSGPDVHYPNSISESLL